MLIKNRSAIKFAITIILLILSVSVVIVAVGCNKKVEKAASNEICLMTSTDRHANIWDEDLLTGKSVSNSFLNQATVIKEIRQSYDDRTVLLDNGDLYQGNVASTDNLTKQGMNLETGDNPCAVCLKELQYDCYTLGNHEWNFPYDVMKNNYAYLAKANIPCVCCNVYYQDTGKRVFEPYYIKTINIDGQDFKVAIIGMENTDITSWDFPQNYPNMCFYSPENPSRDMSYELKKIQGEMAAQGVKADMTIVALHSGAFPEGFKKDSDFDYRQDAITRATAPLIAGTNSENQSLRLLLNSTGVDIVVGGHDHVDYISNQVFKNADGKDVLFVNAAKEYMSKTSISVNKDNSGKLVPKIINSENVDLTKYSIDNDLKSKIQPSISEVNNHLSKKVGNLEGNWENGEDIEPIECLTKQTDSMDLCCEAAYWKVGNGLKAKYSNLANLNEKIKSMYPNLAPITDSSSGIDVDMTVNSYTILRTLHDGEFTVKGIRDIYRFENSLAAAPVSGAWIKELLEYNASEIYSVKDGKVVVATDKRYVLPVPFGLNFHYDLTRPVGDRVVIEGFSNGKAFSLNDTYIFVLPDYYYGNMNNPVLGKLDKNKVLWSQIGDDGYGNGPTAVEEFSEFFTEKYGAIYNTKNMPKYGFKVSSWYIKY